ncbi:hypothetical protein [Dictyobacter arantiisoli]|nr:hypothetical protein [Dictyobacter arantiisoli]
MKLIGKIKQLQIQRFGIKRGEKPHRYYDPGALEIVPRLLLTPTGVLGCC